jgi:hypothetical protein
MSPSKKTPRKPSKKPAPKKAAAPARAKLAAKPAKKPPEPKEPAKGKKKAAAPQAPPPAARKAAEGRAAPASPGRTDSEGRKAAKPRPRAPVVPDIVKPGLGGRWECFRCGAKFYDLNRPEPTCPKCGADQRDKPREKAPAPAPQPERPRRPAVPMGSLLDEDEEPVEEFEADEEDLGLDDSFLTETPEPAEEDEDVDVTALDEE